MKNYLEGLAGPLQELIRSASAIADRDKLPAYLVGGCVRDLMLGVRNLDLDIVVSADGIKFADDLSASLGAAVTRHKRFGTATVELREGIKVDIASSRSEFYPAPASLPIVQKGTLREDLARRDFSINAMAISINRDKMGELVDFFGGSEDLKAKKIRVLHELSFIDDPTRILRAVRFEQRYSFSMEPSTLKYLKAAKKEKMLEKTQPQRLREEMIILLKEKDPIANIKRLKGLYGFTFLHPDFSGAPGSFEALKGVKKEIAWFKKKFPGYRSLDTWLIYFTSLIEQATTAQAKAVCKKLVFRTGDAKRILSYKRISKRLVAELSGRKILPDRIFTLLRPLSFETIILLRAKSKDRKLRARIADFLEVYNDMRLCVSGKDLCALGIKPGPRYRQLFDKVLSAKLNGEVTTHAEELAMIQRLVCKK